MQLLVEENKILKVAVVAALEEQQMMLVLVGKIITPLAEAEQAAVVAQVLLMLMQLVVAQVPEAAEAAEVLVAPILLERDINIAVELVAPVVPG